MDEEYGRVFKLRSIWMHAHEGFPQFKGKQFEGAIFFFHSVI